MFQEVRTIDYSGPNLVGQYLQKYAKGHSVTASSLILDVGVGTGLVGKMVGPTSILNWMLTINTFYCHDVSYIPEQPSLNKYISSKQHFLIHWYK